MKQLVLLLSFLSFSQAQSLGVGAHRKIFAVVSPVSCTPAPGYAHCRGLTIDHTQVGGLTLTNFPVLVSTTLGVSRLQNASCFDKVYTSDSGGMTLIPWEQESCTQSTGVIVDWVLCASCSSSADTILYMSYDNSGISTAQNTGANGPTHVWDANYVGVWHIPDGTTLSAADSTGVNNGSFCSGSPNTAATTGQIDGGLGGSGNGLDCMTVPTSASLQQQTFTASVWAKFPDVSNISDFFVNGNILFRLNGDSSVALLVSGIAGIVGSSEKLSAGTFYYLVASYNSATGVGNVYVNGTADSGTNSQTFSFSSNLFLNAFNENIGELGYVMDELRFSKAVRPSGQITAEYNNQKSGSTFLRIGAEI